MAQKRLVFTSKLPTPWHYSMAHAICIPLMAQSLWKNNGPHWKHLRGRPTIVLSFQDDCPENSATVWTF